MLPFVFALARRLQIQRAMNTTQVNSPTSLRSWLSNINGEIAAIRRHRLAAPRPKRNRARERARREARQLFREYELDQAIQFSQ